MEGAIMTQSPNLKVDVPKKYTVPAMPALRPIKTEAQYKFYQKQVDRLAVKPKLTRDEEDCLHVLSMLIEEYEKEQVSMDTSKIGTLEVLKHLLEENNINASDLGRLLGHRELGSKILRGERQLSKANIITLAKRFAVSPALFLA